MTADPATVELRVGPAAPAEVIGAAVRAAAAHAGLRAERATRLRALVEELAHEARARESVAGEEDLVVRAAPHGHRFRVEVRDRRLPLAPGSSRSLPSRRLAALGFVDHLHITSSGIEGNVAVCDVDLSGDATSELFEGESVLSHDVPRMDDDEAASLEIRRMVAGDAPGVARCVYRCYGYTYLDPSMYRPELLRRALGSGLLHSVVAVTPGGEVVGHCALTFERAGDAVPEGGKLVVDPRYRGHHLAERMAAERVTLAAALDLPGVWAECVTNHPYSQREVIASGGVETGLLIGATPTDITMADLENSAAGRHALLPMWTPVAGSPHARVHMLARHGELLATLAQRLGLEREIVVEAQPATGPTELSVGVSTTAGVAHLRIPAIGADLAERVAAELDDLMPFDLAVVHLDLPLDDVAAGWAAATLEGLGFCWGAWLPAFADGSDVIRLQLVHDRPVDVTSIACARAEGEELVAFVVDEWHRVRHHRG